ncbi:MAG: hypothetical protein A2065_02325 [Alphaproteobacteria bacterium GWB1_45_5]|nr:MAG: hypothetical protein A2065_02325 [Alphaproteobacteria bacterium GWB1_45_5]
MNWKHRRHRETMKLTRGQKNIIERAAKREDPPHLVFLTKIFIQASLPHKDPGNEEHWVRTNGHFSLRISPGEMTVGTETIRLGIPYGTFARLLLMWIVTESLQTKSRTVFMGKSLRRFLAHLGIAATGGVNGSITRLKDQLLRLIHCRLALEHNTETSLTGVQFYLVEQKSLTWIENLNVLSLTENMLELNEKFYEYITSSAVPLDFEVIKAIKQSSFAIDIYVWLTYRMSSLREKQFISWRLLAKQMGSDYGDLKNFKKKFSQHLKTIQVAYPELKVFIETGGLKLYPSPTHIKKKEVGA